MDETLHHLSVITQRKKNKKSARDVSACQPVLPVEVFKCRMFAMEESLQHFFFFSPTLCCTYHRTISIGCLVASFTAKVDGLLAKETSSETHTSRKWIKCDNSTANGKLGLLSPLRHSSSNTMQSVTTTYWQVSSLTHFTFYSKWSFRFYQTVISTAKAHTNSSERQLNSIFPPFPALHVPLFVLSCVILFLVFRCIRAHPHFLFGWPRSYRNWNHCRLCSHERQQCTSFIISSRDILDMLLSSECHDAGDSTQTLLKD